MVQSPSKSPPFLLHYSSSPKMCRAFVDINNQSEAFCSPREHGSSAVTVCCALCGARAALYCQADSAFLCRACDETVHAANILSLRHVRCFLCNRCQRFTPRFLVGTSTEVKPPASLMVRLRWFLMEQRSSRCGNNEGNHNHSMSSSCSSS